MADNLKEVIARLKQKNSQTSQTETPKKPKQELEDEEIEAEEKAINQEEEQEMEIPKPQTMQPIVKAIPKVKTEEEKRMELINAEINLLGTNDGFYRRQLLIQMTELNTSLAEITGILQFMKRSFE